MPVVTVDWWSGGSEEDRRKLVEEVSGTVSRIADCPLEAVTVLISDFDPTRWGKGGRLVADL